MPEHGRAVATQRDSFHLDVFMRSPEATLLHIWGRNGDADPFDNAMDLGGTLDSEPVAVKRHAGGMDVFALSKVVEGSRDGPKILHWSWNVTSGLWSGPSELPGFAAAAPGAVADDDRLYVFARSVDGPIRWWLKDGPRDWEDKGPLLMGPRFAVGDPVAIRRATDRIDIYYAARHPDADPADARDKRIIIVTDTITRTSGGFTVKEHQCRTLAKSFDSRSVTAYSRNEVRQDVFARATDGNLIHWGTGRMYVPADTDGGWYGPESITGIAPPRLTLDPVAVNRVGQADIFYPDKNSGALRRWSWNERTWEPNDGGPGIFHSTPVAVTRNKDTIELVVRTGDYEVTVWKWSEAVPGSQMGWTGPKVWKASPFKQAPPQDPLAGTTDDHPPDFLIVRPDDHVLLGVSAPGHVVRQNSAPAPPTLELPDGDIVVTFPPQHVAEQVSRPKETAAGGVWHALLSGPSRVPLTEVPNTPLNASELLAAFDDRPVDPDDNAIELPRGVIIAPETTVDRAAPVVRHPANPVGRAGTSGIWRSRIEAPGDGDLHIRALRAGRDESFPVALPKADRVLIAEFCDGSATENLPTAKRLELSCLGGTLAASGKWSTFEWDHKAVLGRDQSVRTSIKGVLYPFGHRAVWVEMTERSVDENTAVLRKTNTLYISEPLKYPGVDAPTNLRNAFPFSEIEISSREYRNLDTAVWTPFGRTAKASGELQTHCEELTQRLRRLHDEIFLDGAIGGVTTERLAEGGGEPIEYLQLYAQRQRLEHLIALWDEQGIGTVDVPTYFTPTTKGRALQFPVRCKAKNGDIHFPVEMIFVADLDLDGEFRPPFRSLADSRVTESLFTTYTRSGGGVIDLPGVPIDLMPDSPPTFAGPNAPSDLQTTVHEVRRLNIVGNHHSRGYLPSLGVPGDPKSWAAHIGMPTIRSLVGTDPTAQVSFTDAYLQDSGVDVPLQLIDKLELDFTEMKDRAGGLAGPKLVVDQISRVSGLANTDPAALLSEGASLLGFSLRDLIGSIDVPPELKTIVRDGVPNEVRMRWQTVPLKPVPMFKPGNNSTVTIDVVSSGTDNKASCFANDFTLQIPPPGPDGNNALIEIDFKTVEFRQNTGEPAKVSVDISGIRFVGRLKLLEALQEAIGDFNRLPVKIEAAKDKVVARYQLPLPDVSAMSFVMSNLVFSAALTIPFNKDPVAIEIGFASRERPFTLTVLMFGGGGYVDLELINTGLRRLEISLQFGAAIGMNFGIGKAEVHAFGGIRYALESGTPKLTGYIHIGGSLDVLGLVSVSVELRVELAYDFGHNSLVGRATLVIDIDITLYSDSFELDSGQWVIAGGSGSHELSRPEPAPFIALPVSDPMGVTAWGLYRAAFAEVKQS